MNPLVYFSKFNFKPFRTLAVKQPGKRILKITAFILGGIFLLLAAFHFWFISHAKDMLKSLVEKKTNGRMKLEIEKLSYNYFNRKMSIRNASIYSTDTTTATTAYRFNIKQINIELQALLPFALEKKLLIDSLHLQSPDISVTQLRYAANPVKKDTGDVSLPYEMGKIYNSIQDALKELNVEKFRIADGKFNLINKAKEGQTPVHISNIDFRIENLKVDGSGKRGEEKILFSDNVILNSTKQDIVFPDGRHLLSFEKFHIDLQKKIVEFDSCIISAAKTDKTDASFSVFFDKLRLSDIDFDTLYKAEVIKADTVFCLNPQFTLRAEISGKKDSASKQPKLENIIRQLTGDLLLNYVIVNNASFDITTIKNGVPNSFTSHENNFEMQGLAINQDAQKPIKVKTFTMAIRNYENFIKDSTYRLQFDSILFRNDKIYLSNFLFHKLDNGRIINTFNIPQFYLEGLSWDDLVFEKRLKARQAQMLRPRISYSVSPRRKDKQNVFQSLSMLNEYMELDQLNIVEGSLDLTLEKDLQIQLENAHLSVQSQALLSSTRLAGIKSSLNLMSFDKGVLRLGDLFIELQNTTYTGSSGQFTASHVTVRNKKNDLATLLQEVQVKKMIVDEKVNSITGEGIKWKSADINIIPVMGSGENNPGITISLKDISGANTNFAGTFGNRTISTKLDAVHLAELDKRPGNKVVLSGLVAKGSRLKLKDDRSDLSIASYDFTDDQASTFREVKYQFSGPSTTADMRIPSLSAVPHLKELLDGRIILDDLNLPNPVLNIQLASKAGAQSTRWDLPEIAVNQFTLSQPVIHFREVSDSGTVSLNWNGSGSRVNTIKVTGLKSLPGGNSISVNQLDAELTGIVFTNNKGKTFASDKGHITAAIKDISLVKNANELIKWRGFAEQVKTKDFRLDSLGKEKGSLVIQSVNFEDFGLSSTSIKDLRKLVAANPSFRIGQFSGHYNRPSANIDWQNASFDRAGNILTVNSFSFKPAIEKDSFFAAKKFQSDYIETGATDIRIGPVDLDAYIDRGLLNSKKISIGNAWFTDIKDKNFPFNAGIIKPLPVKLLQSIPLELAVDTIQINKGSIKYTEITEKTKLAGIVPVDRMTIVLLNVKNHGFSEKDSLSIQATGYLLDSIWMDLHLKQSYTDSLNGFLLSFSGRPGDLRRLNKLLIPLASVKVISGKADSLEMRAIGREYLAWGELRAPYSDLKIQTLKDGIDTDKKNFLTFIVNAFVIKKNNKDGRGNVFFIRNRDRSTLNYLVKMLMSGISSATGVKSNKKLMKRYKDELEKRELPPIHFK